MKIFITGAAGLVGSHACEYFSSKGYEVVAFDNLMRSRIFGFDKKSVEFNWEYLSKIPNIKRIIGDVRNTKDLEEAMPEGVDIVIHTAGQPGVPSSVKDPFLDFQINAWGTLNTLEVTRKKNPYAVFIYTSTNKVFGENVDKIPLIEDERRYKYKDLQGVNESMPTDITAHTPYGVSKLTGDLYVQEYGHIYNLKTCCFRMSCIYGERQFGFEEQGWVSHFIISCLLNREITIYGDGKQVRDMLYVKDLIEAFDRFIEKDLKQEVINIGGGIENTFSLLEFLEYLETLSSKKAKIKFSHWRPSDQKVYITDISKARRVLDWSPRVSKEEGVRILYGWIEEHRKYFL